MMKESVWCLDNASIRDNFSFSFFVSMKNNIISKKYRVIWSNLLKASDYDIYNYNLDIISDETCNDKLWYYKGIKHKLIHLYHRFDEFDNRNNIVSYTDGYISESIFTFKYLADHVKDYEADGIAI